MCVIVECKAPQVVKTPKTVLRTRLQCPQANNTRKRDSCELMGVGMEGHPTIPPSLLTP